MGSESLRLTAFTFRSYAEASLKTEGKERTIHLEAALTADARHPLPTPPQHQGTLLFSATFSLYRGSSLKDSETSLPPTSFRTRHGYREPNLFFQPRYSRRHSKCRAATDSCPQITAYRNKKGSNNICSRSAFSGVGTAENKSKDTIKVDWIKGKG